MIFGKGDKKMINFSDKRKFQNECLSLLKNRFSLFILLQLTVYYSS